MGVVQVAPNVGNVYKSTYKAENTLPWGVENISFLHEVKNAASKAEKTQPVQGESGNSYDFTDMTRQKIADIGNALFQQGKISLMELFRFEHPDGILRVNGRLPAGLSAHDRLNFLALTQEAIWNMEQTGQSKRPDSGYKMLQGLLQKLHGWQV